MNILTTWSCKTDQKFLKKSSENFLTKNYERKIPEGTFYNKLFPRYNLYAAKTNLSNFAMPIYQGKPTLEKLELQPPVAPGAQDNPHRSVARPELTGALLRYINCFIDFQSVLHKGV